MPCRSSCSGTRSEEAGITLAKNISNQRCTVFLLVTAHVGPLTDLRLLLDDARWDALLAGYRAVRPWTQPDTDSLPVFMAVR